MLFDLFIIGMKWTFFSTAFNFLLNMFGFEFSEEDGRIIKIS